MQKTIIEWFNTIEDKEVREKAIKNCKDRNEVVSTISSAIFCGFAWDETTEGEDYWVKVFSEL
jgi:hypothetical protein